MNKYLLEKVFKYLNTHEKSAILGINCKYCDKYISPLHLDNSIDPIIYKNYCVCENIDNIPIGKLSTDTDSQIIQISGNYNIIQKMYKYRTLYNAITISNNVVYLVNNKNFSKKIYHLIEDKEKKEFSIFIEDLSDGYSKYKCDLLIKY